MHFIFNTCNNVQYNPLFAWCCSNIKMKYSNFDNQIFLLNFLKELAQKILLCTCARFTIMLHCIWTCNCFNKVFNKWTYKGYIISFSWFINFEAFLFKWTIFISYSISTVFFLLGYSMYSTVLLIWILHTSVVTSSPPPPPPPPPSRVTFSHAQKAAMVSIEIYF